MPGHSTDQRRDRPAAWDARLSTPGSPVCAPDWLALREPADAAARSPELAGLLAANVEGVRPLVIRDLGCGTGSLGRWLAGRLPGPQVWVLHDRDPDLLDRARTAMPARAADGSSVTADVTQGDVTALSAADLAGTAVVAASALLDLLTGDEVDDLAAACVEARCAALFSLSVTGSVRITPSDPLDGRVEAAFNAHQRRRSDSRRLLGPDSGPAVAEAFARRGAAVTTRPSPWRLGAHCGIPGWAELAEEWLRGWIAAACDQQPDLIRHADAYLSRRLDARAAGALRVVVGHLDVLALPQPKKRVA